VADLSELPFTIGIKDLLDAGLHFGHQSKRWNPKMKRFIFEKRNGIYIIDLAKSLERLKAAREFVYQTVAGGKQVVFVGTKKACQEPLKEAALRCGQHYVISRWLGGTLTNHQNIGSSIRRMREIEALDQQGKLAGMPQKEASRLRHELARLQRNLSGIANMQDMPGAMLAVDINREAIAVKEAVRMHIPVVAIVDTNCDPDLVQYPIPGNDDAIRGIKLILNVLADAILKAATAYEAAVARNKAAQEAAAKEKEKEKAAAEAQPRPRRERKPRRADAPPRTPSAPAKPAEPAPAAPATPAAPPPPPAAPPPAAAGS
jgi:small subunit ribosomal protein S2